MTNRLNAAAQEAEDELALILGTFREAVLSAGPNMLRLAMKETAAALRMAAENITIRLDISGNAVRRPNPYRPTRPTGFPPNVQCRG